MSDACRGTKNYGCARIGCYSHCEACSSRNRINHIVTIVTTRCHTIYIYDSPYTIGSHCTSRKCSNSTGPTGCRYGPDLCYRGYLTTKLRSKVVVVEKLRIWTAGIQVATLTRAN